MSHFSLLVISDEKITEETLKKTLQPWHEYACTGIEDQYVVDVDVTDKVLEEFNKPQKVVIESDGLVYSRWDDRFYTKKPKDNWSNKEFELPAGAQEREFSAEDARTYGIGYATLLECAEEYYGEATQIGDRFFRKDNADKWVWLDAKRQEVGRTIGDETLPHMRPRFNSGLFLFGEGNEIEPARKICLLQEMYKSEESNADSGSSEEMACQRKIWFEPAGLSKSSFETEWEVSNLSEPSNAGERYSCGSLSHHTENSRDSLQQLQQSARVCQGQYRDIEEGYNIYNPIHRECISGSKWDWWQVGGRWTGMFRPNYDPNKDPDNKETCILCHGTGQRTDAIAIGIKGCNGCNSTGISTKWPTQWRSVGDIVQIKDIPFVALQDDAEKKALELYDRAKAVVNGREIPNWDKMLANNFGDSDKTRDDFWNDPIVKDLQQEFHKDGLWIDLDFLEGLEISRSEKARRARRQAVQTFAVVKDGQWYQRGEMGWWGCVNNEKDANEWSTQFEALINGLHPDTWVAIVDCHC